MRALYRLFVGAYFLLIRFVGTFNGKAKEWVDGREGLPEFLLRTNNSKPLIWFHCASLGEFEQGKPVMEAFKNRHPSWLILVTFFSPSGYNVRKDYDLADFVIYLPEENTENISLFLESFKPKIAVFVKYEFWYGYMNALKKRNIPMVFVSSSFRPDQIFFKPWGKWFLKQIKNVEMFFVQDVESKILLESHGVKKVEVSGDTRFDRVLDSVKANEQIQYMMDFKGNDKILFFGSAWSKETEFAVRFISAIPSGWKVVFAPHEIHSNRLNDFSRKIVETSVRFTNLNASNASSNKVLILDTVGHLARMYKYADLAFVGGGFDDGIHNILEPLSFGVPVAFGPNYNGFMEAKLSMDIQVGEEVSNYKEFEEWITPFVKDYTLLDEKSIAASKFVKDNSGATLKVSSFLNKIGQIISCQFC